MEGFKKRGRASKKEGRLYRQKRDDFIKEKNERGLYKKSDRFRKAKKWAGFKKGKKEGGIEKRKKEGGR